MQGPSLGFVLFFRQDPMYSRLALTLLCQWFSTCGSQSF